MEQVRTLTNEANELVKRADHLAVVTYKIVNDPKLLIVVIETLQKALMAGMKAVVRFDEVYKKHTKTAKSEAGVVEIFKEESAPRYELPIADLQLVEELEDLITRRKASAVEFRRKEKLVFGSEDYKLRSLDVEKVKKYVEKTKMFINKVNTVIHSRDN